MAGPTDARAPRLTPDQLAFEASAPRSLVEELVAAGAIERAADGTHARDDVARVRLAHALASGGISVDDLMHEIRTGRMPFRDIPRMGITPPSTGRTYAEFAAALGEDRAAQLPALYAAFGLAAPPPQTAMRADEEEALTGFISLWAMVEDRPEVMQRAARIAGEGVRRIVLGTVDLIDEFDGSPPARLRRGLSSEEAIEPSIRQAGVMNALLAWLRERHLEHEVFDRIVAFTEVSLSRAGRLPTPSSDPPAIAFVDLTAFTERTLAAGDETAAEDAATLQALASAVVSRHRGRVVKALGDGIMLRFESAADGVAAVRDLMAEIVAAGLPPAHAGIAAGSFVIRDGDIYGHTVNVAARLSGQAASGEILIPREAAAWLGDGVAWEERGALRLKGIEQPVAVVALTG
ncbi:MAG TPA: adenylate/guanylate cyclase domain-containing protein [Candidatus Limnocylindrales bacterium]|nr:adenylate/guanylate cyclase domain-containing protein [Candidatus Limnocylindrales bacterium]